MNADERGEQQQKTIKKTEKKRPEVGPRHW
jgi:hypothetical protein